MKDPKKEAEKLLSRRADTIKKGAALTVGVVIGDHVIDLLERGQELNLRTLRAALEDSAGDRSPQSPGRVTADAALKKLDEITSAPDD